MSENTDPNEIKPTGRSESLDDVIEGNLRADYSLEQYSRNRHKTEVSGWMKLIGVLILWFGFWGILSII